MTELCCCFFSLFFSLLNSLGSSFALLLYEILSSILYLLVFLLCNFLGSFSKKLLQLPRAKKEKDLWEEELRRLGLSYQKRNTAPCVCVCVCVCACVRTVLETATERKEKPLFIWYSMGLSCASVAFGVNKGEDWSRIMLYSYSLSRKHRKIPS